MIRISGTLSKAWMHRALGVAFDRDYYFLKLTDFLGSFWGWE